MPHGILYNIQYYGNHNFQVTYEFNIGDFNIKRKSTV